MSHFTSQHVAWFNADAVKAKKVGHCPRCSGCEKLLHYGLSRLANAGTICLDYITIEGFKSIALAKLELGRTVLIGPNGSGKSNFIGVFSFLNAIREGRLQEYVIKAGGAEKVLHFGARVTVYLDIPDFLPIQAGLTNGKIPLVPNSLMNVFPSPRLHFLTKQRASLNPLNPIQSEGREAGISGRYLKGVALMWYLDSWRLFHFHDTSTAAHEANSRPE